VVLPDADLKLFIDASPEERAGRRAEERGIDPDGAEAQEILRDLRQRDAADSSRAIAPLRIPAGATVIRTDGNVFETTVDLVVAAITARAEALATPDLAPR